MPKRIQDFAQQALVQPIVVNVGRAGAASMDIIQEVEYVKQEAKMVYLLECLQKTAPPCIIFSDNKNEVDGKSAIEVMQHTANSMTYRHSGVSTAQGSRGCGDSRFEECVPDRSRLSI